MRKAVGYNRYDLATACLRAIEYAAAGYRMFHIAERQNAPEIVLTFGELKRN